jgi:carbon monoxide dehydrogenase subunit G
METSLSLEPENEGTRVTASSTVEAGMPLSPVTDRLAAWKRKGELKHAFRAISDDLE